jgi:hypothetical protein
MMHVIQLKTLQMKDIIFTVSEEDDGSFTARAIGYSIFTEAENKDDLKKNIKEAVKAHFDTINNPITIIMQFTINESFEMA